MIPSLPVIGIAPELACTIVRYDTRRRTHDCALRRARSSAVSTSSVGSDTLLHCVNRKTIGTEPGRSVNHTDHENHSHTPIGTSTTTSPTYVHQPTPHTDANCQRRSARVYSCFGVGLRHVSTR